VVCGCFHGDQEKLGKQPLKFLSIGKIASEMDNLLKYYSGTSEIGTCTFATIFEVVRSSFSTIYMF
jgi:hypothetical protein